MSLFQSIAAASSQQGKTWVTNFVLPTTGATTVATGLSAVDFCGVSFLGQPSLTHMYVSAAKSGSDIVISNEKPTGSADVSPIAATAPFSVITWWAFGDR